MKNFNDDEICDFVEFTKDRAVDIRFIEYMPFAGNKWKGNTMVTYKDMVEKIKTRWPDFEPLPNHPNDTSKAWRVPGFVGQVGFISSMSDHFCGSCNRIRLTADGNLKVCLFGNAEVSLRDAIRNNISEDDLMCLIGAAIRRKSKQHAGFVALQRCLHLPMHAFLQRSEKNDKYKYYIKSPITVNNTILKPHNSHRINARFFSSQDNNLSHVDDAGKANMVNIGSKETTKRIAKAQGQVKVGARIVNMIRENEMKKGDVLTVAQIAGIMAAKRTSEIIPLCHNISLSSVNIKLDMNETDIFIYAEAKCIGQTGVEMEALTAVAVTALTIYDMCKSVSHNIRIENIILTEKDGGKSHFVKYNTEPIQSDETFYPTYV